jgi:hypothetical protein
LAKYSPNAWPHALLAAGEIGYRIGVTDRWLPRRSSAGGRPASLVRNGDEVGKIEGLIIDEVALGNSMSSRCETSA